MTKIILLGFAVLNIFLLGKQHSYSQYSVNIDDSILMRWKYDSTGCLGRRSIMDGKYLIEKYKLIGKSQNEVELIMGKANTITEKTERVFFIYLIDGSCDSSGRIKTNMDFCTGQLIFIAGKLRDAVFSCT